MIAVVTCPAGHLIAVCTVVTHAPLCLMSAAFPTVVAFYSVAAVPFRNLYAVLQSMIFNIVPLLIIHEAIVMTVVMGPVIELQIDSTAIKEVLQVHPDLFSVFRAPLATDITPKRPRVL